MKLRNRKGSTLALTIIIFAVLMIFATFTMGFMVTENKQSIYYQNKTQAYYIAKSGADIIGEALNEKLLSITDIDEHNDYIKLYTGGKPVSVGIDGIVNLTVNFESINGNNVLTITTTAKYPNNDSGVFQTVKKVIYNNRSLTTSEYFIPNLDGKLFQYLNQDPTYYPEEILNAEGHGTGYISENYVSQAPPDKSQQYKDMEWPYPMTSFTNPDPIAKEWTISGTNFTTVNNTTIGTSGTSTDIHVDGSLTLNGNVTLLGDVNIYVKDYLTLNSSTNIIGDINSSVGDDISNKTYKLNIYVYGESLDANRSVFTNGDISNFKLVGNINILQGDVDILFKKDSEIDGSLIYHGDEKFEFSSDDNGKNKNRIIGGSILAPHAHVKLGIDTTKVEMAIGGFVISDMITVYANTSIQSEGFYSQSGQGNKIIQTEIPNEFSTLSDEAYGSYYINSN